MKTIIGITCAVFILLGGCTKQKDTSKNTNDSTKVNKRDFDEKTSLKRSAPKAPAPVKLGGVEYSAPVTEMGYIIAKDLSSNKELWKKPVYEVSYDKSLEKDVQDVYIDSLWLSGGVIMVRNEKGLLYELNPATQNVTRKN